jgi:putative SOS response-associated peptidase YedK
MCGRFVSATPPDELARYFDVDAVSESVLEPSFNVAPTNDVYVVLETGGLRRLDAFHWGLVPFWAKDLSVGNRMINARADSLADKNAYKRPFAKRRCIIPADGFFEWQKVAGQKAKQPFYITRTDGEPFAFAGLWELWRPPDNKEDDEAIVRSCTIITGDPNEKVAEIHDRMPVMLPPPVWETWLDPDNNDVQELGKLLVPAPATLITTHPVSTKVNNVREKGPELIEPAGDDPVEATGGGGSRPGTLL